MRKKILFTFLLLLILIPAAIAFNPINWVKSLFVMSPPEIERAWADPVKILPDQIMTTNIIVKDAYGIQEITAEIPNENGVDKVKLHLIEGDEKYGTWQNAWKEHDAKNEKWYTTKITVTNKKGIKAYAYVEWQDPTVSHPASQVTAGTFDSGNYTFDATNKDLFIDDTNGRVGIGTTAPGDKLQVKGSARFGEHDITQGTLISSGSPTGSSEGGELQLDLAADYGATFDTWVIDAYENDLRFFTSDAAVTNTMSAEGRLTLPLTGSNGGINLGGDTLFYRSAADVIRTPDSLTVDGILIVTDTDSYIRTNNITSTSVSEDLSIRSVDKISLDMDYDGGQTSFIYFKAEGTTVGSINEAGNLDLSGTCDDTGTGTCESDIAEKWHSVESLKHTSCEAMNKCKLDEDFESEFENGDVVCAESGMRNIIRPCNGAYDPMAVSVLSYNATITIGQLYNPYPISLAGNVAVKVICDKPIKQGDSLVSAEQAGWAMKLDVSDVTSFEELQRRNNAVFAKALEDCESGRKVIRAWI